MKRYSFVVKGPTKNSPSRLKVVDAINFKQSLNKVLALFPARKILTNINTKNMDLITAKVEAAKKSRENKNTVYINVDNEGECKLSDKLNDSTQYTFTNGNEVAMVKVTVDEPETPKAEKSKPKKSGTPKKQVVKADAAVVSKTKKSASAKTKTNKTMKTAKKATKKTAKKVTAKKSNANRPAIKGVKKSVTVKEIISLLEKGVGVYTVGGTKHSLPYCKNVADKSTVREVIIVK